MQYILINLFWVVALLGIDQAIKYWAVEVLQPVGSIPVIPHVVELRFTYNQGMAFSMLSGKQLLLVLVTGVLLIGVAYWLFFRCRDNLLMRASMILVLGGGLGNFIDRVLNGQVVDYINLLFMRFAIFNFADICLCVGCGLWALSIFLEEAHTNPDKTQKEN